MAEDIPSLALLYNRALNSAYVHLVREGLNPRDYLSVVGKYGEPPEGYTKVYFGDLQQEWGRMVWSMWMGDCIGSYATPAQTGKLNRLALAMFEHFVPYYFGMDKGRFYIAVESKDQAMLIKLAHY